MSSSIPYWTVDRVVRERIPMTLADLLALPAEIDYDRTRRNGFAEFDPRLDVAVLIIGGRPVARGKPALLRIGRIELQERLADVVEFQNLVGGSPRRVDAPARMSGEIDEGIFLEQRVALFLCLAPFLGGAVGRGSRHAAPCGPAVARPVV